MGAIISVRCPRCGYANDDHFGVGGDFGFLGDLIVTAICTTNHVLVDTNAGSHIDPERPVRYEGGRALPGTCLLDDCRSRSHTAWDPDTAICPACGEPGCRVVPVGLWD